MLIDNNDPLLHRPSLPVTEKEIESNCRELKPIISLLFGELYRNNAYGVSACQLGYDKALFVMSCDGQDKVCINPEMIVANTTMSLEKEGCLSFKNLYLTVRRPIAVGVRYYNHDGVQITEKLEGLAARIWLHEFDHLNGICFTDRVSKLKIDLAKRKQEKRKQK